MLQICRSLGDKNEYLSLFLNDKLNFAFLNFGLNLVVYRSLKGKTIGLGTNVVYGTWQLEYFEGNQNLDKYLNLYKLCRHLIIGIC